MNKVNYTKMSDEELVSLYQQGDEAAADFLVRKYKNLVRVKARSFFLVGADDEDLLQEGMIGLYKAIRDYDATKDAVFMTFASLCIANQIRTAITAYNRQKHAPLNNSVPFEAGDEDGAEHKQFNWRTGRSPEDVFFEQIRMETLMHSLYANLSKMEVSVLELYLEGMSYEEIARKLEKTPKSIDNAIQRVRAKIAKIDLD